MELRKEKDFSGITKWNINILPFNPTTRNLEKKNACQHSCDFLLM